jgi:transcriptional regulator with XRE-family HTH domain
MKRSRFSDHWREFVRSRRGHLSQAAFGRHFEVSGSYVSAWENSGVVPSEDIIKRGAEALGDDPYDWMQAAGYAYGPDSPLGIGPQAVAEPALPPDQAQQPLPAVVGQVGDLGVVSWEGEGDQEVPVSRTDRYRLVLASGEVAAHLWSGKSVVIDPRLEPRRDDLVILREADGVCRLALFRGKKRHNRAVKLRVEVLGAPGLARTAEVDAEVIGVLDTIHFRQ